MATATVSANGQATKGDVKVLEIDDLTLDERLQHRESIDPEKIEEYAEAMADGDEFPPIGADCDGKHYWVWDGFQRIAAARQAGLTTIRVLVAPGTFRTAWIKSLGANGTHGKDRTHAEKRAVVAEALDDPELAGLNDLQLAKLLKVSHTFIRKMRKERAADSAPEVESIQSGPAPKPRVESIQSNGHAPEAKAPVESIQSDEAEDDEPEVESIQSGGGFVQAGGAPGAEDEAEVVLDQSEIRPRLSERCRAVYDADARLYLDCAADLKSLRDRVQKHEKARPQGRVAGPFASAVGAFTRIPHPGGGRPVNGRKTAGWVGCLDCERDGVITGRKKDGVNDCPSCHGRGFHVATSGLGGR